jgi:uncharacterized CHY-type Zn-finger protein
MSQENNKEPSDAELDKLAENLYNRLQRKKEQESEKNEETKKTDRYLPYAICTNCNRALTREQYLKPNCPHCGNTKANIIQYGDAGPTAPT